MIRFKCKKNYNLTIEINIVTPIFAFFAQVAITWWTFWMVFAMAPLNWWAKRYRMVHDTYQWMPKRIDGTKGYGNKGWFLE